MDNSCNEYIPSFCPFNQEFFPGNRLIDFFSDQFSFHYYSQEAKNHIKNLNHAITEASSDISSSIIILDASIKNNIATSISHIHSYNKPIIKTIHQAINITTTKAELFIIRCSINQAINISNLKHIIIVTDSIHTTERIFDSSSYPYQTHSTTISMELREFFKKDINNCINFWDCPSKVKWPLHLSVNSDTRKFPMLPSFPCKSSWNFCKEYDDKSVLNSWKMSFQALNYKGRQFLELLDSDLNSLEPSTKNSSLWLKQFSHSNSLCARATRAVVNHTPTGEYWLGFFPNKDIVCSCGAYPIETRRHILHKCKRFNNYWNLRRDTIAHFTLFLEYNNNAFFFGVG